jgi:hypothetical protein
MVFVKGKFCLVLEAIIKSSDTKSVSPLAEVILEKIPGSGRMPEVVQLLQTELLPQPRTVLFLRNFKTLGGVAGRELLKITGIDKPDVYNRPLKMSSTVDFALAIYEDSKWPGPNVVWVAKYPSIVQALQAHRRYSSIISKSSAGKAERNMTVIAPHGKFLVGSWTMESESVGHLINKVSELIK